MRTVKSEWTLQVNPAGLAWVLWGTTWLQMGTAVGALTDANKDAGNFRIPFRKSRFYSGK